MTPVLVTPVLGAPVLGAPALCLVVASAALPVTVRALRRAGVVDVPGRRSSHAVATPRGGGIAVVLGMLAGALLVPPGVRAPFVVALAGAAVVGLVEDLHGISVRLRLVAQTGTAGVVAWLLVGGLPVGAVSVIALPVIALPVVAALVVAALVVTVLVAAWVVVLVNVVNFMDGVNGITGAHAVLGGLVFGGLGAWRGDPSLGAAGLTLAAGGLAFLPWNAGRARVFLGDVGSYALGAGTAVLVAHAVVRGVPWEAAVAPVALHLADTAWTLQRRVRAREPWSQPHRTHVYQRLCDLGWSHRRVTATTVGLAAVVCGLGAAAVAGNRPLRLVADGLAVLVLVTYLCLPALLGARTHPPHDDPEGTERHAHRRPHPVVRP